jgi:beta-fructofuranosidase
MAKLVFYRPQDGFTADIIPFYDKGSFHLFYLHDYRNITQHGEGTPWYQLSTKDFVNYVEYGETLSRGDINAQDLFVFTGSVIKVDDTYHIYYTGHNPHLKEVGKPEQGVMHATSTDLINWTKHEEDTFYAPVEDYDANDWRDPFVFYNPDEKCYWMILAARSKNGPSTRRGCSAKCISKDLKKWSVVEPLWEPNYHYTHECPDLFYINGWWYLIYSEFTDQRLTRYRMAKDLKGPWICPQNDSFDGRAYYAAKSASDGTHRYLFGWVPTKQNNDDNQPWQWGGNLLVHEIYQNERGELSQKTPESVVNYFSSTTILNQSQTTIDAIGQCIIDPIKCKLPNKYHLHVEITFDEFTTKAGIALRHDEKEDQSYVYLFDKSKQSLTFDCFPNSPWQTANYLGVTRYLELKPYTPYTLDIYVEDDVCCAYVNLIGIALSYFDRLIRPSSWKQ